MRKIIFYYIIVFLFGCISCTANENEFDWVVIDSFPESIELQGTEILENEKALLYVSFVDTLLLSVVNRDTLFHMYDKQLNHIASFGQKGRGPQEFILPPLIQDVLITENTVLALHYDQFRKELVSIDINSSIETKNLVAENIIDIPRDLWGMESVFYNSHQKDFIGIYDDRDERRLDGLKGGFYYFSEVDSISAFNLFNLKIDPFDIGPEMNLNATAQGISPDRKKLAVAKFRYPGIEIFDIGSTHPARFLLVPEPPDNQFNLDDFKAGGVERYSQDIYLTNSYFYLLTSKNNKTEQVQYIKVIDWSGRPIVEYVIPDRYDLTSLIVDEENGKIYGSSYMNDSVFLFNYR